MHVTVLGSVKSRTSGSQWGTLAPSARQLLAILAAAGREGLSFERTADELWPHDLPATWDPSLRMAFTRLRRHLPIDSLVSKNGWCRLDLDTTSVDLWHAAELAESATPLTDADAAVDLIAQDAFPNVEVSPIIRAAIDEFDLLRSLLVHRLLEEDTPVSPLAASRLATFAELRDWDADLRRLADQLASAATQPTPPTSDTAPTGPSRLPSSLGRHRAHTLVGRDEDVGQLVGRAVDHERTVTTLAAAPQSGRSAVLAAAGEHLVQQGWRVIHLEAARPAAAFGPFLQALPDLREPLRAALGSHHPPDQVRSLAWTSILQAVDHRRLPTCVLVDDAELLDSNSEQALEFVARSSTSQPLAIIATVDPSHPAMADSSWLAAPTITLEPIAQEHIETMVAAAHPDCTDLQRMQLTREVAALANGLGGRAHQLIHAADAGTLTLPSFVAARTHPDLPTIDLDIDVLRVAVAASITRTPVSLADLEHITRESTDDILASVDVLLGLGVLGETSKPDVFGLGPAHRHADLSAAVPPHELARFHRRAMALPDRSPVALAAHALQARPLLTDAEVADAQLTAATMLSASRSHREAVAHFRAAEALDAEMDPAQLTAYAASLQFIGIDAPELRQRAVTQALANQQPGLALDAALAGLPSAEQVDGDPVRLALIESIDPEQLDENERISRHIWLSRQLLLASRKDDARREADAAAALATSIDHRADAWLALVHTDGWMPTPTPAGGFEALAFPSISEVTDPARRARLHQAEAISSLIAGDFPAAERAVIALADDADACGVPLRIWHAAVLQSTLLTNDLRFDEADRVADRARDFAVPYGLAGAVSTRLAQWSNHSMHLGTAGDQLPRIEAATPDARFSLLARAGHSLHLAGAGRTEEALDVAAAILEPLRSSRFGLAGAGVLSPVVAGHSPTMASQIRALLEPHQGQMLIIGAGIGTHGPIEGLLANVASDPEEALDLRARAVEIADRCRSPLWHVMTRVALAEELDRVGDGPRARTMRAEAAERAANTEFARRERWGLFDR